MKVGNPGCPWTDVRYCFPSFKVELFFSPFLFFLSCQLRGTLGTNGEYIFVTYWKGILDPDETYLFLFLPLRAFAGQAE